MIKKIEPQDLSATNMTVNRSAYKDAIKKMNEIIDVLNGLNKTTEKEGMLWKLCRFNDYENSPETVEYGILSRIDMDREDYPYYNQTDGTWYAYCEPVKPDDEEIYKGE